jgi:hypothetical protein
MGSIFMVEEQAIQETSRSRWLPSDAGILFGLLFGPEDSGDMYFRNVRLIPNHTALNPEDRPTQSRRREKLKSNKTRIHSSLNFSRFFNLYFYL